MQLTVISVMSFAKEPQKPRPLLRQLMRALARASAQNAREYFCNHYCQLQVQRASSLVCRRYLSIHVIGNVIASLNRQYRY
jgi:hypothetical protein